MDLMRFELMASSLQRRRSAAELQAHCVVLLLIYEFETRFVVAISKDTMYGASYIGQICSIFDFRATVFC